jgi:hypothetical protein
MKPEGHEQFQGASMASQTPVKNNWCSFCMLHHEHPSMVANVEDVPGYPLAKLGSLPMHSAMTGETVVNFFMENRIRSCCAFCCEKLRNSNKDPGPFTLRYIREVAISPEKKIWKVTSAWTRLNERSRGKPLNKHHAELQCKLRDQQLDLEPGRGVTSAEIYEASQNKMVRRASNWVCQIGRKERPFMWVFFGCKKCMVWTVRSNSWLRCQRLARLLKEEFSSAGLDDGHWRCATCFDVWSWTMCGDMRLVVMGQADPQQGFKAGYTFALIGEVDDYVNNLLNFLTTASLLEALDGKKVTGEHLMAAIELLNAKTEATFSTGMKEVDVRYSMDVPQEKLNTHQIRLVCEDPRLSLHAKNQCYLVIDRKKMDEDVEVIDKDFLIDMLHLSASAYDMDASWPSGDGMRRVWRRITESPAYNDGLRAIRDRMSRM